MFRTVQDRTATKLFYTLCFALVVVSVSSSSAQEFFRVSPGKLNETHADLDNSRSCTRCHDLGGGVTNDKCLACHKTLSKSIRSGKGLHARFQKRCIACHTQHKGRGYNIIDWRQVGGRENFDHDRTGFKLEKKHSVIACASCHKKRTRSGRTYYPGLSPECGSCHRDVHSTTLRACKQCHQSRHRAPFAGDDCKQCHAVDRPWKPSSFDHDQTRFPLRAGHREVACGKCHRTSGRKPGTRCAGCHGDPHQNRFSSVGCGSCHKVPGGRPSGFDHRARAGFALRGRHAKLACASCHRKGKKLAPAFADLPDRSNAWCLRCHTGRKSHAAELSDKRCTSCHPEGGAAAGQFNHDSDSRFPLTGYHARLGKKNRCGKCHQGGIYRSGKSACSDCHKDAHAGQLGADCSRCHSTGVRFAKTAVGRESHTRFPLVGKHRKVKCEQCHLNDRYRFESLSCYTCHAKSDPHRGRLGKQCEKCHTPEGGAPGFDHERMTGFARTGKHRQAACGFCHRVPEKGAPLPEPGWTAGLEPPPVDRLFPVAGRQCNGCHRDPHQGRYGEGCGSCHSTVSFEQVERARHETGAFRLQGRHEQVACARCHAGDRRLEGLGTQCQQCHFEDDAHNNALGRECGRCHNQHDWLPARFSHASVGYPLRGAHRTARCKDCHGIGTYQGIPTDCAFCHQKDAARVTDPLHTDVAFARCEQCHRETGFSPARFSHQAYPLRGAHRPLPRLPPGRPVRRHLGRVPELSPAGFHQAGQRARPPGRGFLHRLRELPPAAGLAARALLPHRFSAARKTPDAGLPRLPPGQQLRGGLWRPFLRLRAVPRPGRTGRPLAGGPHRARVSARLRIVPHGKRLDTGAPASLGRAGERRRGKRIDDGKREQQPVETGRRGPGSSDRGPGEGAVVFAGGYADHVRAGAAAGRQGRERP